MRPPSNEGYEKVKVGDFIAGIIDEVCYEKDHEFTYLQTVTKSLGIRFKLLLDGCEHPKYTKWMKFSLGARSNLYKKFVSALVEGATPNMDFDLDELQGVQVLTYWTENEKGYQNVELIKPSKDKIIVKVVKGDDAPIAEPVETEVEKSAEEEVEKSAEEEVEKSAEELITPDETKQDEVNFDDLP